MKICNLFRAKYYNGTWWDNTHLQWTDVNGNLVTWDINSHETSILVSADQIQSLGSFRGFSPNNENFLLFYKYVYSIN